ncbi:MAG: helix-turn-helix domain-containing protein [Actinomycetia bacterium]|nr:helix-turn-helix domain-containing protein [Actinomycetes bacterium]
MNVEIAERLAKRRRSAGYSQETLAEKLGVTRQAVSKWERSESSPDTDNLIALAKLYGVSLDDLLYVDESIADDVSFEQNDKAGRSAEWCSSRSDSQASQAEAAPGATEHTEKAEQQADQEPGRPSDDRDYVHIGWHDGIHINDPESGDYVHLSFKEGIHVCDAKDGDEVHVGWDGIHVKEGQSADKQWASWDDYKNAHPDHWWHKSPWMKFPFPILAILAYVLIGLIAPPLDFGCGLISPWAYGLFALASIPLYYMAMECILRSRPSHFFRGIYPLAAVVFFLWMWLLVGQPHPAWVVFLTVPIYEWIVWAIRRSWKKRKAKRAPGETKPDSQ